MELVTLGKNFYPDRVIKAWYNPSEDLVSHISSPDRLKIITVVTGNGVLEINGHQIFFIAPSLLCLNNCDSVKLIQSNEIRAEAYYFHPEIVNASLNLQNIFDFENLSVTDRQDAVMFKAFTLRTEYYNGAIPVGPETIKRFTQILSSICQELTEQWDSFWPCRTRSYFLELLMLVSRVFNTTDPSEQLHFTVETHDTLEIILYLYNNYQRKLTLSEITKTHFINRNTLNSKFLKATGHSVMAFLIKLRIQLASTLLRDTNMPITEVYERVGFSDATHFGRTFNKHMGCSPSDYRVHFRGPSRN